ncbi:unnamed protein product [Haemonchus placei]|uniref:G_PROTEIN_RECEP_F1_2 domain-containing protein n=1 Tax=Haemonchus placei TaxID=6290 RepID=A0A158QL84_HAEPC|nr:unnamed protein product [Haemonchus placei]
MNKPNIYSDCKLPCDHLDVEVWNQFVSQPALTVSNGQRHSGQSHWNWHCRRSRLARLSQQRFSDVYTHQWRKNIEFVPTAMPFSLYSEFHLFDVFRILLYSDDHNAFYFLTYIVHRKADRWFYGIYLGLKECYIVFHASNYLWEFSPNYCGFVLGKVLDFGTGVSVFILIIIMDVFTIYRIRTAVMRLGKSLRTQELKFFAQSCLQFSLFVIKLTNFYFISGYFIGDLVTYHWPAFCTTTFAWEITHCIDGLILIPFHYHDWKTRKCRPVITGHTITKLIVISWPIESRKILNQRNTKVLIGIAWFLGFLHFIPYFRVEKCYVVFYASKYIWEFSPNYCGFVLGKVLDFGTGVSVFILIIIFDLYTVLRIRTVMIILIPFRLIIQKDPYLAVEQELGINALAL